MVGAECGALSLKFRFLGRRERATDNRITGREGHLARRNLAYVVRDAVVDLISQCDISEAPIVCCASEIDGLQKYLIQVAATVPPIAGVLCFQSALHSFLSHLWRKCRGNSVKRHHLARWVS